MGNFVDHVSTQPNVLAATNEPLENLGTNKPNASLASNSIICVVAYPSGATPVITDDKSNSWPVSGAANTTVTADAGAGNMALQAFVLSNAATGTQKITVGFGGSPQIPVRVWITEVPFTVGTIKGSTTATAVNAAGVVSPGAFTPTQANCLVLSYMSDSNTTGTTNPTLIAAASGYALNDADISWNPGTGTPSASQWLLQGAASSTTASFTLTGSGTETYNVLALALSTATPGTAVPAGIHIDRELYFSTNSAPASWKLQIPSTGNLGFIQSPVDTIGAGSITATDSDSIVWTNQGTTGGPIFLERDNQTPSATRTITFNFTGHTGGNYMARYCDVSGAAVAPFDKTAFLGNTGTNNTNSIAHAPDITPSTANGLVFAVLNNGLGPTPAITSPASAVFDEPFYDIAKFVGSITTTTLTVSSTTWGTVTSGGNLFKGSGVTLGSTIQTGASSPFTIQPSQTVGAGTTMFEESTDGSQVNWGNGFAHIYNPNTNALNFTWSIANQPSASVVAGAIAFKAAPTTVAEAGAAHENVLPALRLGTPISRLRSGLEDTTPSPGPVGLPQGEISVGLPTSIRLGTPLSRLRSGLEDTTPSPGPMGLPQGEQEIQLPFLRLGTPLSRLRGVYSDVPTAAVTILNGFGIAFGVGPATAAIAGTGALAGLVFGQGPVLASIKGSAAMGGLAFAQGPTKGAMAGTGVLAAVAVGTGFVYSGVLASGVLTGTAFGVGPSLGSITGFQALAGQGLSVGFGYSLATGSVSLQQAGHGNAGDDWLDYKRRKDYRLRKALEAEERRLSAAQAISRLEGLKEASKAENIQHMADAQRILDLTRFAKGQKLKALQEEQRQAERRAKEAQDRRLSYEAEQERQRLVAEENERIEEVRVEEEEASEVIASLMMNWDEFFPRRKH